MVTLQGALARLQSQYEQVRLVSTSYLGVGAGDIVVVSYPRTNEVTQRRTPLQRIGFIMSSNSTPGDSGLRISTRLNQILNFVDAELINEDEFADVVDKLYNEELEPMVSKFKYAFNGDVGGVPIMDKFKTFKISEISGKSVLRIEVDNNG
tara:strand:+ start:858 stop:1310 length:453 start_codon:yes stop_codon:yes gene_type:complete